MNITRSLSVAAAALTASTILVSTPATATMLFSADASATLSITGVSSGNPAIHGNFNALAMQFSQQQFSDGNASALSSGYANVVVGSTIQTLDTDANPLGSGIVPPGAAMGIGDSLQQQASASGQASSGIANAGYFSTGLMSLEDFSGFTVDFLLSYSYSGSASTEYDLELAFASVEIRLLNQFSEDVIEPIVVGATGGSFGTSGSIAFSVPDDFGFEQLTLLVDASGGGVGLETQVVAVPEPNAIAALTLGVLGLLGFRRSGKGRCRS